MAISFYTIKRVTRQFLVYATQELKYHLKNLLIWIGDFIITNLMVALVILFVYTIGVLIAAFIAWKSPIYLTQLLIYKIYSEGLMGVRTIIVFVELWVLSDLARPFGDLSFCDKLFERDK